MTEQTSVPQYTMTFGDEGGSGGDYTNAPLKRQKCVVKIGAVRYARQPSWKSKMPDYSDPVPGFSLVLLPYETRDGETLKDVEGKDVAPLSRWVFKNLNPASLRFTPSGEPSVSRSFLWESMGLEIEEDNLPIGYDRLIVFDDKKREVVGDDRKKYLAEIVEPTEKASEAQKKMYAEKPLTLKGYSHLPDFRHFVGHYLTITIGAKPTKKGGDVNTTIGYFEKMPKSFKPDEAVESEAKEKFEKGYAKMLEKQIEREESRFVVEKSSVVSGASDELVLEELEF